MEFLCKYCNDWLETNSCQSHFENQHGQPNITFEKLSRRWKSTMGGIDTRDEETQAVEQEAQRPVFVTNNFQHHL